MSLAIDKNHVVSMHYKLTDDQNNVIDSSEGSEPLNYLHGAGNIIPGLEKELTGQEEGAELQVRIAPEDAYGNVEEDLVQKVEKSAFPDNEKLEPGMVFQAQAPDGSSQRMTIREVEDEQVTVDANHPLAGVPLNFDVEITGVREATPEEIKKGHPE